MRASSLVAVPLFAVFGAMPSTAQVSARLHVDIPIGRPAPVVAARLHREVVVHSYAAAAYGPWETYYDDWTPVTLYLYGGYYYDYPVVAYAQPVLIYSYRHQFFFPPRDRDFAFWRRTYRAGAENYRAIPAYRGGADWYRAAPGVDRGRSQYQPRRDERGGQYRPSPAAERGRRYDAAQQSDHGARDFRPVRSYSNSGRSRSRPR